MRNHLAIDIWCWPLCLPEQDIERALNILSSDELERARRFHFDRHRHRYIAGRGQMRHILASYVHTLPGKLHFVYNRSGKPFLDRDRHSPAPHFNLSHSHDLACLAVSSACQPGIDIEQIRPIEPELSRYFFSHREHSALNRLQGDKRLQAFYRLWTLKEAFVKAHGAGLSIPPEQIDLQFGSPQFPCLSPSFAQEDEQAAWQFLSFTPKPGFAGALATNSQGRPLSLRRRMLNELSQPV